MKEQSICDLMIIVLILTTTFMLFISDRGSAWLDNTQPKLIRGLNELFSKRRLLSSKHQLLLAGQS